jgi:hypothetical protein
MLRVIGTFRASQIVVWIAISGQVGQSAISDRTIAYAV